MISLLVALGAGGVLTVAVVLAGRAGARRTESLRVAAAQLGWGFVKEAPADTIPSLDRFELFTQGRRRRISRVLTSPDGEPRLVVFEYAYTTGGGNAQRRHRQTVLYAKGATLDVPSFSVRPQHFGHGIAKAFGYQDIDPPGRPQFSRMNVLRGADGAAVGRLFGAESVAGWFEAHEGVCAAGSGGEVLLWRAGRRVRGEDIGALIEDGVSLYGALVGGSLSEGRAT